MQNTSPLFKNSPTLDFAKILGMVHMVGSGGHLICVIMTHYVRKPICDSSLNDTHRENYGLLNSVQ